MKRVCSGVWVHLVASFYLCLRPCDNFVVVASTSFLVWHTVSHDVFFHHISCQILYLGVLISHLVGVIVTARTTSEYHFCSR